MLNWPPGNIFVRIPSQNDYKSIKISSETPQTTFQKSSQKYQNVTISENRFLLENSFVKSRPHMAAQADPQSGKCSYVDPLSFIVSAKTRFLRSKNRLLPGVLLSTPVSHKHTHFFIWSLLWFISCRTYSLLRRVWHNSKIESKSGLLNNKWPKMSFSCK